MRVWNKKSPRNRETGNATIAMVELNQGDWHTTRQYRLLVRTDAGAWEWWRANTTAPALSQPETMTPPPIPRTAVDTAWRRGRRKQEIR